MRKRYSVLCVLEFEKLLDFLAWPPLLLVDASLVKVVDHQTNRQKDVLVINVVFVRFPVLHTYCPIVNRKQLMNRGGYISSIYRN